MKNVKINGIEFAVENLKAAGWLEEHLKPVVVIERQDDGVLVGRNCAGDTESVWQAQTADRVRAVDGRDYSICLIDTDIGSGVAVCPTEDGPACADHMAAYEMLWIDDDWEQPCDVAELAYDIGRPVDHEIYYRPDVSAYEVAARQYVSDHPGARYYIDPIRGFANEWTLHILTGDAEPSEGWEETVRPADWLADAIMDPDTYDAEHLATKCVGAVED